MHVTVYLQLAICNYHSDCVKEGAQDTNLYTTLYSEYNVHDRSLYTLIHTEPRGTNSSHPSSSYPSSSYVTFTTLCLRLL